MDRMSQKLWMMISLGIWSVFVSFTSFSRLEAHQLTLYSETEVFFETVEKRHAYPENTCLRFPSISLQSRIFTFGPHSEIFPLEYGLEWLQTSESRSRFTTSRGFQWASLRYPEDFEVTFEKVGLSEYQGRARTRLGALPWAKEPLEFSLALHHESGEIVQSFHHGFLEPEKRICFVEYQSAGLKEEKIDSQDRRLPTCLSLIRAVIAFEGFEVTLPSIGKYYLSASFSKEGTLLAQGKYYFEIYASESRLPEKEFSLHLTLPEKISKSTTLTLEIRDGLGKPLSSLEQGYIRKIVLVFRKDGGYPEINDEIVRDFRWIELPPYFEKALPLKIQLTKMWLNFFGEGTTFYSFEVTREYSQESIQTVSGTFLIQLNN
jgi:hypothetical protein